MSTAILPLLAVLAGYLLGAIPFGVVVCRPLGKDPRRVGSGRTGGTNVYRTAGAVPAILTVLGDGLKGAAAVWLAIWLVPGAQQPLIVALAALAAILGHNYSVYVGFAGGAGSSPNIGAFLALSPNPLWFLGAAVIGGLVWKLGRMASVASLSLSAVLLLSVLWFVYSGQRSPALLVYGVGQLGLVAWALRPNIKRLLAGGEIRVDSR
ncbi:MAG TPA: glycerol-3-phosphate acyltransferase [Anaerolineae bacterium]|nr:glycerol-3-phosphate acyltransferase [Ardenticatenia bacterium]HQZ70298.1 glycerol-3-phosphate acyltransferase [Anaerolineae bacterium]HRA19020.1 glycerol-3-phosphate acyltransferase [Anaerolineae bacterium]